MSRPWYKFPSSDAAYVSIWFLLTAAVGVYGAFSGWSPYVSLSLFSIGATIGIGVWLEKTWAIRIALGIALLLTMYQLYLLFGVEFSTKRLTWTAIFGCMLWTAWDCLRKSTTGSADKKSGSNADEESTLISIVMLLREPKYLDETMLQAVIERAWGVELNEESGSFLVGESPMYVLKTPERMFLIHNHETPYFNDTEEVSKEIGELRLRKAVQEHRAWASVDLLAPDDRPSQAELDVAYRLICKLIAALADGQCGALLIPQYGKAFVYDEEMDAKLRSETPLEGLNVFAPVVEIADDDPEMLAAVDEALRRWPEFVEAFRRRRDLTETFSVKAPISDGLHTEFMWLTVTEISDAFVIGKLGNEPVNVTGVKLDDDVRVPCGEVRDWLYFREEEPIGGFSIRILTQRVAKPTPKGEA